MTLIDIRTDEDLLDFKIELVLARLFENEDTAKGYRLTPTMRKYTAPLVRGLQQVYSPVIVRDLFAGREKVGEQELVRLLMNDFLEEKGANYFNSVEGRLWDDVEKLGIRTRAFEMGLAVHLIQDTMFQGVLEYDVQKEGRYIVLNTE